jgi:acetyl esterase/lipase
VWFLKTVLWAYFGVKNFHEDEGFRLTSITERVTGIFPGSFISSGDGDPLAPQAGVLAQKLAGLGVQVEDRSEVVRLRSAASGPLSQRLRWRLG